jgi:hypothetical protein
MTEQVQSASSVLREEILEEALRILETLRPLEPIQRALLLHRAATPEGRAELGRLRDLIADLLSASLTVLALLGLDRDALAAIREAAEVLLRASMEAAALARTLSANGTRLERAERSIGRALAARRGGGGWFELKWVTGANRKRYGPYLYYRWRDGAVKRSQYRGKSGKGGAE